MITCTRRLQFCAGHRVMGHENKCANLHGHNYIVMLEAQATLDDIGRVIDFSVLKEKFGGWIDHNWDHGFILHDDDSEAWIAMGVMDDQKTYAMPDNPTAENMANYLLLNIAPGLLAGTGVRLRSVRIWETENCYADAYCD